ncbi:MAG: LysR family transcriptional regulator [Pseudobdellovibrio sp.]
MKYRITDLKNFVSIAGSRTMREGADKLEISQPALSESIKRLEDDIGEVLFYRSRAGIEMTPVGKQIYIKAKNAVSALDSVSQDDHEIRGSITIGCHPLIGSYFLPKAMRMAPNLFSKYQINLRHDLSRNIQLEIQHGKIDIGLVVNAIMSPDLIVKTLGFDEVCVWQNRKADTQLHDRLFCDLSLFQTQSILRKWKDRPQNIVNTENLELIARFVNEGLGYGILPARAVGLLNFNNLYKITKAPTFQDKISIVYRPEFGKNNSEKTIIESLKKSVEE